LKVKFPPLRLERLKPYRLYLALAAGSFVLAWLLVAFVIFPDEGLPETTIVPAVLGLRYAEARQRLESAGLEVALGESRVSGSAPRSTVLAQSPAPGSEVANGATITLDVSAGQQRSTIPRLAGLSREGAIDALRRNGLATGQIVEQAAVEARGTVLRSQPDAGQVVPQGTAVDLVLSAGPAELSMPDVVGRGLSEVRATLEQLGLSVGEITYDSASTFPPGMIIAQIPAAAASVPVGGTVTLRVSGRP
jgi:serine/threonine-protein kinase